MTDFLREDPIKVTDYASREELARLVGMETPAERERSTRVLRMRRWLTEQETPPQASLVLRCSSPRRAGKQCRLEIGRVWSTPSGSYLATQTMPFVDAKVTHLAAAHDLRARGLTGTARAHEAAAGPDPVPYDAALDDPLPGLNGHVLIGCRNHGNCMVSTAALEREAASTRRVFSIDVLTKIAG